MSSASCFGSILIPTKRIPTYFFILYIYYSMILLKNQILMEVPLGYAPRSEDYRSTVLLIKLQDHISAMINADGAAALYINFALKGCETPLFIISNYIARVRFCIAIISILGAAFNGDCSCAPTFIASFYHSTMSNIHPNMISRICINHNNIASY